MEQLTETEKDLVFHSPSEFSSPQLPHALACYTKHNVLLDPGFPEFVRFLAEQHFSEDFNHRIRGLSVFLLSKGQKLCIYLPDTASYSQPETPLS